MRSCRELGLKGEAFRDLGSAARLWPGRGDFVEKAATSDAGTEPRESIDAGQHQLACQASHLRLRHKLEVFPPPGPAFYCPTAEATIRDHLPPGRVVGLHDRHSPPAQHDCESEALGRGIRAGRKCLRSNDPGITGARPGDIPTLTPRLGIDVLPSPWTVQTSEKP